MDIVSTIGAGLHVSKEGRDEQDFFMVLGWVSPLEGGLCRQQSVKWLLLVNFSSGYLKKSAEKMLKLYLILHPLAPYLANYLIPCQSLKYILASQFPKLCCY